MDKRQFVLINNIAHYAQSLGSAAVFVTVTFQAGTSHEEVRSRWNSFTTNFLKKIFSSWIAVTEFQKNGTIHYHLVADAGFDASTGFKGFYRYRNKQYTKGASERLKALWRLLRERSNAYGIGRIQTEPVRSHKNAGFYLAKYISKSIDNKPKGMRLISYSRVDRLYNQKFSFVYGYRRFRAVLEMLKIFYKGGSLPKEEVALKNSYTTFVAYKTAKRTGTIKAFEKAYSQLVDFFKLKTVDKKVFSSYTDITFCDDGVIFTEESPMQKFLKEVLLSPLEKSHFEPPKYTKEAYEEFLNTQPITIGTFSYVTNDGWTPCFKKQVC